MQITLLTASALCLLALANPSAPVPAPETPAALVGTALFVECPPPTAKLLCGDAYDPSITGEPIVSGGCEPYKVDYVDVHTPGRCAAGRFDEVVHRTWTISDSCGNTATCTQNIHIVKKSVVLDLHPRSCPNPFNRGSSGKYPAAILGTPSFDVHDIVPGSLQLWGFNCQGGPAIPLPAFTTYADVSAPYTGGALCGCTTDGPDGFTDLIFKFDKPAMEAALALGQYANFSNVQLVITGELVDGCSFVGSDCIRVQ